MFKILNQVKFSNSKFLIRQRLQSILVSEYKYEFQNYQQEPEIKQIFEKYQYTINDDNNSHKIQLYRDFNNYEVIIEFQATAPEPSEQEQIEEKEDLDPDELHYDSKQDNVTKKRQLEEAENKIDVPKYSVDFQVYILSKQGEAISFECNSMNQTLNISRMQPIYDFNSFRNQSRVTKLLYDYSGPEVNLLEDRLRLSIYEYLSTYDINNELISAIEALSMDKEQRLYMDFLKKLENFISI
ncbi:hypothetical protein pb186bvf_002009 [Paramecium bursaria]